MGCGGALEPAAAPLGERKVITALFCDLVGSTELADRLDPEDVDALLRAYHAIARRRIQAFGGRVEKFIGDAVVGVFGVPLAHEDDPERAVRTGLRLIDELGASDLDVHVRIGICTGETLVRTDVAGDAGEGFATGDTLNIAARLQSAAPVDGVAVAASTQRACGPIFRWDDLGELALKGRAEPMHAWRPIAPVARIDTEASDESTPFVGRDLELETLERLFERSRSTPSIEVVTVVAEPGIGKSRLVRELHRYIADLPDLVTWRTGRCLPYGDGISFWALAEIVAAHAGILETDDQPTLSAKLDTVLAEHDPSVRSWMKDRLGPIVGLEVEASGGAPQEEETFAAWRRFIEGIARTGPMVLIVEDLHWADDAFVRFLAHLAANSAGLPIMLVVTARPEIEERHPSWLARARRSTVLSLAALPDAAVADLVRASLPGATPELVAAVQDRAAGSPLYAEQLAAMLRERAGNGIDDLDGAAIPASVHALLTARIDALPADLKPMLLDASVIGRSFWSGAVATLGGRERSTVEPALADLSRRELARPSFPTTIEGEAEFAFWHALVRDVAYGALPRAARVAKHRAAAEWISERSGSARGRTAEIVAEHLARALDLATVLRATEDVAAIREAYARALVAAASHARSTSPQQAAAHARRALDVLDPGDPQWLEADLLLGLALYDVGHYPEARDALERARPSLLAQGGPSAAASIAIPLSGSLAEAGDAARATTVLEEARVALAKEPGPDLLAVMSAQAMQLVRAGGPRAGEDLARRVVTMADAMGVPPPPRALMALGGDANYARAIAVADAAGDLRLASKSRYNRTVHFRGDAETWLGLIDDSIDFDRAHGVINLPSLNVKSFTSFFFLGRSAGVIEDLELAIAIATEQGDVFTRAQATSTLVEVLAARGEPVGSLDELIADWDAAGLGDGLQFTLSEAAFAAGDHERARSLLTAFLDAGLDPDLPWRFVDRALVVGDRALAERVADGTRAMSGHHPDPDALVLEQAAETAVTSRLAEADGNHARAIEGYRTAWTTFADYGWNHPANLVRGWLGRSLLVDGPRAEAAEHLDAVRAFAASMGLAPWMAELDALVDGAGERQRIDPSRTSMV